MDRNTSQPDGPIVVTTDAKGKSHAHTEQEIADQKRAREIQEHNDRLFALQLVTEDNAAKANAPGSRVTDWTGLRRPVITSSAVTGTVGPSSNTANVQDAIADNNAKSGETLQDGYAKAACALAVKLQKETDAASAHAASACAKAACALAAKLQKETITAMIAANAAVAAMIAAKARAAEAKAAEEVAAEAKAAVDAAKATLEAGKPTHIHIGDAVIGVPTAVASAAIGVTAAGTATITVDVKTPVGYMAGDNIKNPVDIKANVNGTIDVKTAVKTDVKTIFARTPVDVAAGVKNPADILDGIDQPRVLTPLAAAQTVYDAMVALNNTKKSFLKFGDEVNRDQVRAVNTLRGHARALSCTAMERVVARVGVKNAAHIERYVADIAPIIIVFKPEEIYNMFERECHPSNAERVRADGPDTVAVVHAADSRNYLGMYDGVADQLRPKAAFLNLLNNPEGIRSIAKNLGDCYIELRDTVRQRCTCVTSTRTEKGETVVQSATLDHSAHVFADLPQLDHVASIVSNVVPYADHMGEICMNVDVHGEVKYSRDVLQVVIPQKYRASIGLATIHFAHKNCIKMFYSNSE